MAGIADILRESQAGQGDGQVQVWIAEPPGYLGLPVAGSQEKLEAAMPVLVDIMPPEQMETLGAVLGVLELTLGELEQRNCIYCGIGWHNAPDGTEVSSSLVVSLLPTGDGRGRTPRMVLAGLVEAAAEANEKGQADEVELPGGPALFFERIRRLPRPQLPGVVGDPGLAEVYQLEAVVPNEDGSWIATIEFSTPNVHHGVWFREMIVLMANSVSFKPPPALAEEGSGARNIHSILGGG
ncbi:MAG TPA: hypothetical protein VGM10_34655 [Actinocrinis sp.]|jgi:hypothetical protein